MLAQTLSQLIKPNGKAPPQANNIQVKAASKVSADSFDKFDSSNSKDKSSKKSSDEVSEPQEQTNVGIK